MFLEGHDDALLFTYRHVGATIERKQRKLPATNNDEDDDPESILGYRILRKRYGIKPVNTSFRLRFSTVFSSTLPKATTAILNSNSG